MHVLADVVFDWVLRHFNLVEPRGQSRVLAALVGVNRPATLNLVAVDGGLQQRFGGVDLGDHPLSFISHAVCCQTKAKISQDASGKPVCRSAADPSLNTRRATDRLAKSAAERCPSAPVGFIRFGLFGWFGAFGVKDNVSQNLKRLGRRIDTNTAASFCQ